MSMSTSESRIIDPILTTHARGYAQSEFVGHRLFPKVSVNARGGQVIEFGKEAFKKYQTRRTAGENTARIRFGYAGKPFALVQDSIEAVVPFEQLQDAAKVPGVDLAKRAVSLGLEVVQRALEEDQAALATDLNKYKANNKLVLSGSSKWSDDSSHPITNIDDAKEAVRKSIGLRPNVGLFSAKMWKDFKNNPNVRAAIFKDGDNNRVVTKDLAAEVLELDEVVIGDAISFDDNGEAVDVWGYNFVLAYVPKTTAGAEQPSYGYTYELMGAPFVETPYSDRNAKSWLYPATYDRAPVISGMDAGFLIQAT